ncbi:MFS transporter [Parvibium lacunae]|uniref:MFS transporter n=1 Tax=Parvibium lacunae TaxID=1888893 RepID=A0A368L1B1_9BURK|nr:MFS transporter [Parvibium lacunae]RCS57114.1 MFS transporter [Parvibium lacunae]
MLSPFSTPSLPTALPPFTRSRSVAIFVSFALAYWLSYGLRAVNAVIGVPLQLELGVSSAQLGFLSSLYFLTFASMQLPLGLLLDRYGPKRVEVCLLLVAAAGSVLFALAPNFFMLCLARAAIGVGVSACLMAPYKGYRQWFAEKWQAPLSSWMLMVGTAGALSATLPVSYALPIVGWRGLFWLIAGLLLLALCLQATLLPNHAAASAHGSLPKQQESWHQQWQGFQQILRSATFWRYAPPAFFIHGGFMAIQGLWAGPWMQRVSGLNAHASAQTLFHMGIALLVSYFFLGWLARWLMQRQIPLAHAMTAGMALSQGLLAGIIWFGPQHAEAWWIGYSVSTCVMSLGYTAINLHFPIHMSGRATTALNFMIFFGAFVVQWGLGIGIDALRAGGWAEGIAYQASFGALLACQLAALLWFIARRQRANPARLGSA